MRVRLPVGRSAFFLAALLLCLVALLPLRLALDWLGLDEAGVSAREVKGSIWFGGLGETRFGPFLAGDAAARLRILPLLLGRATLDLERPGERDGLRLAVAVSRHGFGLDDASGRLTGHGGTSPLPILALDLSDVSLNFRDGLCSRADGLVTAHLAGEVAGIAFPATLTGTATCADGALRLPLVGQSGMEGVDLRIAADGSYRAGLSIRSADEAMQAKLATSGFRPTAEGYVLSFGGAL